MLTESVNARLVSNPTVAVIQAKGKAAVAESARVRARQALPKSTSVSNNAKGSNQQIPAEAVQVVSSGSKIDDEYAELRGSRAQRKGQWS